MFLQKLKLFFKFIYSFLILGMVILVASSKFECAFSYLQFPYMNIEKKKIAEKIKHFLMSTIPITDIIFKNILSPHNK